MSQKRLCFYYCIYSFQEFWQSLMPTTVLTTITYEYLFGCEYPCIVLVVLLFYAVKYFVT